MSNKCYLLVVRLVCFFILANFQLLTAGEFVFDKKEVLVTAAPDEEFVGVTFSFTVQGVGEAVVKKFEEPACSCLEAKIGPDDRKVWQPGEKSYVSATFKVGTYRGTVKKSLYITMKNGQKHKLTVAMTVPQLITVEPKTVKWKAGDESTEKTFKVILDSSYAVRIKRIEVSNPEVFEHQLIALSEGREYLLKIKPKNTASRSLSVIRISTDSEQKRHKVYRAYAVVVKDGFKPKDISKSK